MPSYDHKSILDKEVPSKSSMSMRKPFIESNGRQRANTADNEHSVEAYMLRSKKAAGYLRQILHSQRCCGQCETLGCIQTTRILRHVPTCQQAICSVAGCDTTKKLLMHYEQCRAKAQNRSMPMTTSTCLICSIACSSSPVKQLMLNHSMVSSGGSSGGSGSSAPQTAHTANDETSQPMDEDEDDEQNNSFSSDEVITFNRIPFQNNQQQCVRLKTYSDSEFAVPVGVLGSGNNRLTPSAMVKARSKSMNAMSIEELGGAH